ncbi:MAG: cytidyltransferase, partial [Candidatus Margulisiibacteriota bacterium]
MNEKILVLEELIQKTKELRKQGKKIVQSHGVYDIIHPGIIQHLTLAKKQGDILVVTVIKDKHVRLGPGRPLFNEQLRLDNVTSLAPVDYVALVDENTPFECVRLLKPDIFAKGRAVRERDQVVHGDLFESEKEANFGKTKIFETEGFTFHTQQLVNNFLSSYPDETKDYLSAFSRKYSFRSLATQLNKLKNLKVLLIGDGIIDEYHYCDAMGRSSKAHLVVNRFINHEVFAGGAFALANHLSSICDRIKLVTLLGENDTKEKFISKNLRPNVDPKYFYRKNSSTIVKKRYLNNYSSQKLFEVNYLD